MPNSEETIQIRLATDGEKDFRRLASEFHQAARGEVQRRLRQHLYQTAMPILNDLRAAVMGVNVQSTQGGGTASTNLRKRVASAVRANVAYSGVRFGVAGGSVGPYGAALAKYLDSELPGYKNWRHPVFGGPAWTVQHGQPWFFTTIDDHENEFEQACYRAIADVLRGLE